MTDPMRISVSLLIISILLLAGPLTSLARAADCRALEMSIRKERNLISKKTMISEAIKECPKDAPIMYQDGYSLERLRKYEEAIQSYKKAIAIDPAYAKAYFSLGDIQMLLKNYKDAVSYYQLGLKHQPGDGRAKASLTEAQSKLGILTGSTPEPAPVKPPPPTASAKKEDVKKTVTKPKAAKIYAEAPIMRLQVPFYKKTTALSQEAKDVLAVVVGQAMNRKDMAENSFEIGGHTDNLGDANKNYEISKKRANNVRKYLKEDFGIAQSRLKVAYHGQKKPRVTNSSPANQKLNRRVDFTKTD
jgi:outer membrane protein OmpA-like peptidoglycan-associated protein